MQHVASIEQRTSFSMLNQLGSVDWYQLLRWISIIGLVGIASRSLQAQEFSASSSAGYGSSFGAINPTVQPTQLPSVIGSRDYAPANQSIKSSFALPVQPVNPQPGQASFLPVTTNSNAGNAPTGNSPVLTGEASGRLPDPPSLPTSSQAKTTIQDASAMREMGIPALPPNTLSSGLIVGRQRGDNAGSLKSASHQVQEGGLFQFSPPDDENEPLQPVPRNGAVNLAPPAHSANQGQGFFDSPQPRQLSNPGLPSPVGLYNDPQANAPVGQFGANPGNVPGSANPGLANSPSGTGNPAGTISPPSILEPLDSSSAGVIVSINGPRRIAPSEATIYELTVNNSGPKQVERLELLVPAPPGITFLSADLKPNSQEQNSWRWNLGTLEAGGTRKLQLTLRSDRAQSIDLRAVAMLAIESSVRTEAIQSKVKLDIIGPPQVMIDEPFQVELRWTNVGEIPITNLSNSLRPSVGIELDPSLLRVPRSNVPINPGESQSRTVKVIARQSGLAGFEVVAQAPSGCQDKANYRVQVNRAALSVGVQGPNRSYSQKETTYLITVKNSGDVDRQEVVAFFELPGQTETTSQQPAGEFVGAPNMGTSVASPQYIFWRLGTMPAGTERQVSVTVRRRLAETVEFRASAISSESTSADNVFAVQFLPVHRLALSIKQPNEPLVAGRDSQEFIINLKNEGPTDVREMTAQIYLSPGLEIDLTRSPQWRPTTLANVFQSTNLRSLASGGTSSDRIWIRAKPGGEYRIQAITIQGDNPGAYVKHEEPVTVVENLD